MSDASPEKPVRKVVPLPPSTWKRVDEWRFQNRVRTEFEAVRRLMERGLAADDEIARLRALLAAAGVDPDEHEGRTP